MLSEAAVAVLSCLSYQPDAQLLVNVHPFGGVYWADEMPGICQFIHCLRQDRAVILRMFSIRRELWSAEVLSNRDKELWDSIRAQVPTWPLFRRMELTDEDKLARKEAERQVAQELDAISKGPSLPFDSWKQLLRRDCELRDKLVAFDALGDDVLRLLWEAGTEPSVNGIMKNGEGMSSD